jgi:Tfp pilus assembly protein PilV
MGRGFTGVNLIEVLVALVIMSVVLLGLAAFQITAYQKSRDSLDQTLAAIESDRQHAKLAIKNFSAICK